MAKAKKSGGKDFSFETSMDKLEKLVERLEAGELTLEESLAAFEEGVATVKQCRAYLEKARQRVEILVGEEGSNPLIEPYEEDVEDDDVEEESD